MSKYKKLQRIVCATFLACGASVANAAAIRIDDSSTAGIDLTVYDAGWGDWNSVAGAITYIGSVGNWAMNVTTGITKPILGTNELPLLHLDSINVSSGGSGTLNIWFSENNFVGSPDYLANFVSSIGGLTGGSITLDTYLASSNALFDTTGTAIDSLAMTGWTGSSGSSVVKLDGGNYSLTIHATVTHAVAAASSFNAELKVPEPGTLSLLGAMLAAAGFVGSRRRVTADSRSA